MSNIYHILGENFSGRSDWLQANLDNGLFIGSEAINFLSGIVTSVEDEILLHQKQKNIELIKQFKEVFDFDSMWQTSPTRLSGGEVAILSIFTSLLLKKQKLNIDNTLEQLNAQWRIKLFNFIRIYFPKTSVFIADNRFKEYGVETKTIKPKLTEEKVHSYVFNSCNFDILSFSKIFAGRNELVISGIHFSYTKQRNIFKDLSLKFTGGIYHLKGINGAGKSTLSKILVGIEKPQKGKVIWNGKSINPYKFPGKYCTYTTQNPSDQISNSTVATEIIGSSIYDLQKLNHVLEAFGLQELASVNPEELPFVIRKRINLASIIYDDKSIIIFDEPTLGQDDFFVKAFASLINRMKSSGKIIIVISHSVFFISQIHDVTTIELEKKI